MGKAQINVSNLLPERNLMVLAKLLGVRTSGIATSF
jgi:hypothetical protein